jgi:hypothetical protein
MISPKKSLQRSAAHASVGALLTLACVGGGCYAPQQSQADTRGAVPPAKEAPAVKDAPGAKESVRAPVQPVPAESRTPEEAAKRAADPKDPSGALIIEPPKSR